MILLCDGTLGTAAPQELTESCIIAIVYPFLKWIEGCVWLFLQAQKGNCYLTELAGRVEYVSKAPQERQRGTGF